MASNARIAAQVSHREVVETPRRDVEGFADLDLVGDPSQLESELFEALARLLLDIEQSAMREGRQSSGLDRRTG